MSDDLLDLTEKYEVEEESESKGLTDFLFPPPAPRNSWGIIKWWESRRLHYNAIVGGTGLLSMGLFTLLASLPPNAHHMGLFLAPIIAYGVLANLCYFLGPTAEIFLEKLFRGKLLPTGPVLFRMGLTFAVGLTMLPTLFAAIDWVIRIIFNLL